MGAALLLPELAVAADDPASASNAGALSVVEALGALESLPADSPAPESWDGNGSRKGWFGESWMDIDGNGCDTRNDILGRDLLEADYSRAEGLQSREEGRGQGAFVCRDATVWTGRLHDPYTGAVVDYQRGEGSSPAVQIDHVVPLNYLYAHGAWQWDERRRLLVANDPLNLLAVAGQANQDKGNCGPATCPSGTTANGSWRTESGRGWWPPRQEFRCEYAARFVSVASAYQLGLPAADRNALQQVLADCVAGGDGTSASKATRTVSQSAHRLWNDPMLLGMLLAGLALLGIGLLLWPRRRRYGRLGA
ncbi:Domain of uncharacterised function (DUF1994) [Actinomyces bovis]|uniref:Domain of uncharacterized function (DUF1994) n=2 Tax=Actinomyces bovis TaxID=1658 RepID=A0ABY1VPE9_9ACTO|nr:Domain of uncharacterised function (DUF1994) [Actinomyces bovis]VEG53889.1 Domain of uncharacterised function (DUF1994) [Actinomyces israelii]